MLIITGRGPLNFAGGRYNTPEIIVPSKLFQRTISGSGNVDGSTPPTWLDVQRVTAPDLLSTLKTSPCILTDPNVKPRSVPDGCQRSPVICPGGSFGRGRGCSVFVSNSSS